MNCSVFPESLFVFLLIRFYIQTFTLKYYKKLAKTNFV